MRFARDVALAIGRRKVASFMLGSGARLPGLGGVVKARVAFV